ncbi:MAG TPA: VWA domain-containing protein [Gaiellaceae bacterium]|nr:VWA domain-containing protein [Gaiellaceae bacterium]
MTFERPLLLLALLALPLAVGLYVLAERRRARYAVTFTNLEVLAAVAGGRPWRRFVPPALLLLALAAVCAGLARPHVERLVPRERATVILVVDVSRSMQAKDVRPTRLAAAQAAVRTFLDRVPDRLRVALVAFAGDPQVAAPPTLDHELVRASLDQIHLYPGYSGTAIGDALALAVELAEQAAGGASGGGDGTGQTIAYRTAAPAPAPEEAIAAIAFLSDGSQTRGFLEPHEGAALAQEAGVPVYTISLGTPEGTVTGNFGGFQETIPVPPDPVTMAEIAETTGGKFFAARDAGALEAVYEELGSSLGREPGQAEITAWLLAAAAAALAAALLLSALWSPRLP